MINRVKSLARAEEGFTLIELLVVVAIIALLASFAAPKLFEAMSKSKKAPGQADMQTISSALERYYFDLNNYPKYAASTPTVATDLAASYLKSTTTYQNGYKKGYLYFSDTNGSYYVLVDPGNSTGAVTLTCGANTDTWTGSATPGTTLGVATLAKSAGYTGTETAPTAAQLANCALSGAGDGSSLVTN